MPAHTLTECRQFADAVAQAQGRVPEALANILAAANLLARHSATTDPARGIVDAAVAGELDTKRLHTLIAEAATDRMIANYAGELHRNSERLLVEQFHKSLRDTAADEVLTSLRPAFDKHAEAITRTRELVPAETDLTQWLSTAKPEAVTAWQALDSHLAAVGKIAAAAAEFGPQLGRFPVVELFAGGDNFKLSDTALFCCGGDLQQDSSYFRRPGAHRASPFCRTLLRLNTVAEAKERYRQWCSAEWQKSHYNRTVQFQKPDGSVGELQLENPFTTKEKASTT